MFIEGMEMSRVGGSVEVFVTVAAEHEGVFRVLERVEANAHSWILMVISGVSQEITMRRNAWNDVMTPEFLTL